MGKVTVFRPGVRLAFYFGLTAGACVDLTPPSDVEPFDGGADVRQMRDAFLPETNATDAAGVQDAPVQPGVDMGAEGAPARDVAEETSIVEGLVGYWKLDEGSGTTALDASGNGHAGALMGGPVWTAPGFAATFANPHALGVDGIDDKVRIARTAKLEPAAITVSAWVKPIGTPASHGDVIAKLWHNLGQPFFRTWGLIVHEEADPTTISWYVTTDAGGGVNGGGGVSSKTGSVLPDVWTHVVGSYDPAGVQPRVKLYVNGVLDSSTAGSGPLMYDQTADGDLYLGFGGAKMWIDDVRIYDRALSAAEVTALHAGQ